MSDDGVRLRVIVRDDQENEVISDEAVLTVQPPALEPPVWDTIPDLESDGREALTYDLRPFVSSSTPITGWIAEGGGATFPNQDGILVIDQYWGTFDITVWAINDDGTSQPATFEWYIKNVVISYDDPQDATIIIPDGHTFAATAEGPPGDPWFREWQI